MWNLLRLASVGLVLLLLGAGLLPAHQDLEKAASSSTSVSASVRGQVSTDNKKPLPQTVIFLAPLDESVTIPLDTTHVVEVSQKGARFIPSLVVVAVGQTVHFRNDEPDPVEHNVFSNSDTRKFDLGLYGPGTDDEKTRVTFDKPGPVRLYCSIHRNMDGVVYVAPTRLFAIVADDGSYKIDDVPPGNYRLRTWQRTQRFAEHDDPITVAEGVTVADVLLSKRK